MISDDSLTEIDDSFFDLYSTKKVTNTYNAVLEKIKSASSKNEVVIHETNDGTSEKVKDVFETAVPEADVSFEMDSSGIIVLDDSPGPVSILEERPGLRRSTRLNKKGRNSDLRTNYSTEFQARNKTTRSNKRKKIDSDVEIIEEDQNAKSIDVNTSVDDEINYEVSVKVLWKSVSVQTFRLRRFQKFSKIFEHFAQEENISMDKILLSLNGKKLGLSDTPESVDLKVYDFIDGGVLSESVTNSKKVTIPTKRPIEKDSVLVKLQDVSKKVFSFSINKNEPIKSVMIRYAEQIEVPMDKIRFYFDGEVLNPSETPTSLGLENDEIIDVKVIQ